MLIINDLMKVRNLADGTYPKFMLSYCNKQYIVKSPKSVKDLSVYTEYIASNFIQLILGKDRCQSVYLGFYNGTVVAILRDFIKEQNASFLKSYRDLSSSFIGTSISGKDYSYDEVLDILNSDKRVKDKELVLNSFWDMFIMDAILGNRDRHWGNWGLFYNKDGVASFAPIYDNGASLYPGVFRVINEYISQDTRRDFMLTRVKEFPASVFTMYREDMQRQAKTNYLEMFINPIKDLSIRLKYLKDKDILSEDKIIEKARFVCDSVGDSLDRVYKRFFLEIIILRYLCIINQEDFSNAFDRIESLLNSWGYIL